MLSELQFHTNMLYHGINIHPKIARELDEILAGNSSNSNEDTKDDNR